MSFWSGEKLERELRNLIDPFERDRVDCASYTLRVGPEVYISPNGEVRAPSRHTKQYLKCGEGFAIPPGQFAFILTEEQINVPDNAIAFISIKAKIKLGGLVNISGFHVDPGYSGRLLFSVLNAGPRPIHLERGQKVFLIWYADIDRPTKKKYGRGYGALNVTLVNNISGEILSLQSLSERMNKMDNKLLRWGVGILGAVLAALVSDWFGFLSSPFTGSYK